MCDPFCSWTHVNVARGGQAATNILQARQAHAKLINWIAKIERWQRTENKGHWLGEQPETCGSWGLRAMQEMQRENWNTVLVMCNEKQLV